MEYYRVGYNEESNEWEEKLILSIHEKRLIPTMRLHNYIVYIKSNYFYYSRVNEKGNPQVCRLDLSDGEERCITFDGEKEKIFEYGLEYATSKGEILLKSLEDEKTYLVSFRKGS